MNQNITALREAKQLAKYNRQAQFFKQLNEPMLPFTYRPAKAKAPAAVVRMIPRNANRRSDRPGPLRAPKIRDTNSKSDSFSSAASAYSRGFSSSRPQITQIADGVVIRKRELLSSISGTSAFTIAQSYSLNPGLAASFPWLSTQAVGWEQYKFRKLRFVYYTRCGTSNAGSIMLVPDYDAADAAPATEQQAMDYKDAREEAPWVVEFSCDLTPSALHPGGRKFIRQGAVANTDIKTYDSGNMYCITVDGSAVNWGKLFVEYEVELAVSQLPQGVGNVASGIATASTTTNTLATMKYSPGSGGVLTLSGVLNSLAFSGLIVGNEYSIVFTNGTGTEFTIQYSSLVGGTVITSTNSAASANSFVLTFSATATSGSVTLSTTQGNPGAALISLNQIGTVVAV
jgi:hypothetical protein